MRTIPMIVVLFAFFAGANSFAASSVLGCKAVAIKAALKAAKQPGNAQTKDSNPAFISVDQDEDDPNNFVVSVTQDEECMANYTVTTRTKSSRNRKNQIKCTATTVVQSAIDCG